MAKLDYMMVIQLDVAIYKFVITAPGRQFVDKEIQELIITLPQLHAVH